MRAAAAILLFLLTLSAAAVDPASALPPTGFEGWNLDGAPRIYRGEALYDHIDGGGEPFLELGFERCEVRRYTKGRFELTAELYKMDDAAAAFGIYAMQCAKETPDPALAERHTVGATQLTLLKGQYLLRLTGKPGACPYRATFLAFAARAAAAVPTAPEPPILGRLPEQGRVAGSLRVVRGAITFGALAPPFEGDALLLERRVTAVAADYAEAAAGSSTLLLAEYPDEASAMKTLASLKSRLETGAKLTRESEKEFLFEVPPASILGRATVEGKILTLTWGVVVK